MREQFGAYNIIKLHRSAEKWTERQATSRRTERKASAATLPTSIPAQVRFRCLSPRVGHHHKSSGSSGRSSGSPSRSRSRSHSHSRSPERRKYSTSKQQPRKRSRSRSRSEERDQAKSRHYDSSKAKYHTGSPHAQDSIVPKGGKEPSKIVLFSPTLV